MAPPGSKYGPPKRVEIVLWTSPEKHRYISKGWPGALIDAFFFIQTIPNRLSNTLTKHSLRAIISQNRGVIEGAFAV